MFEKLQLAVELALVVYHFLEGDFVIGLIELILFAHHYVEFIGRAGGSDQIGHRT